MLIHADNVKYKVKPTKPEIGGIKSRFTKSSSIKDLSVKQIAAALVAGKTIEPGVCPFSERSRKEKKKGTSQDDFERQTIFLDDIDNENKDAPQETPEHIAELLAENGLKAVFMYQSFHSKPENFRFRFAVVCDEEITDKKERERIQGALIALSPQSDVGCINADRIFFGTDKGLIDQYTDFDAVCSKADLLALADKYKLPDKQESGLPKARTADYSGAITKGSRNRTLSSAAFTYLKKYGETDKAVEAFMQTAVKCEPPLEHSELQTIWNSAVKGYREKILPDPNYLPPDKYAAQEFAESVQPQDYTDVGQARVFVNHYGDKLRYSTATKWLVYDGQKWNESEIQAQGLVQELTDGQLKEARKMLHEANAAEEAAAESEDDEQIQAVKEALQVAKSYRKFVLAYRKSNRISATLTESRPSVLIDVSELDKDPFLLNTPAGTVDLRTGRMKPHDPNDYCTKMTAVSPSMDGMDEWLAFLDRVTCGDRELQEYQQIVSGMEIVGKVFTENLIIAHGIGGNGKSTYYNAEFLCLGDYAGSLSAETLTVNCRKNKSPEYAELRGKRFILAAELEEGMRLDTAIVKKLCSTDPIMAEKKFKDPFTFIPSHTVVLYTNHLPKVGTTDKGTWDRLVVVPFNANFRGMQGEIKNYAEYLFEHCGGAILLWMIQGAKKYIEADYIIKQPKAVQNAVEKYRATNDWLDNFLDECCEVGKGFTAKSGELYTRYKNYCDSTGDYRRSLADFKQALTAAGFETKKTKNGAIILGLRIVPDTSEFTSYSGPSPFDDIPPLTG